MRGARVVFALISLLVPLMAQKKEDQGPTDEKAQKTFQKALDLLHQRMVRLGSTNSGRQTSRTAGIANRVSCRSSSTGPSCMSGNRPSLQQKSS